MTFSVRDSDDPEVVESLHEHVKDAIRVAMDSGRDVYVHSEDCESDELGRDCPCRPTKIPGWRR